MGCKIAEKFEGEKQYKTFFISHEHSKSKNSRNIPRASDPQKLEESCPSLKYLFKDFKISKFKKKKLIYKNYPTCRFQNTPC